LLDAQRYGIPCTYTFVYNESLVQRARNRLVDEYLKNTELTHAIFIDADIGFEPDEIFSMLEMDLPVIGAGCVKKNVRWDRIQKVVGANSREYSAEELLKISGDYVINFAPFTGEREMKMNEPQKVNQLGTGVMMIQRQVFDKYKKTYPDRWYEGRGDQAALAGPIYDFFRTGINYETRDYESEDYWFCNDCIAMGYDIWLCPWVRTTHQGSFTYTGDMPAVAALMGKL
jgi:hypothetical protein